MECYFAKLKTNWGADDQVTSAGSNAARWNIFQTNNTAIFGTSLIGAPTVERNIQNDDVLLVKQAGLILVNFYAEWPNGNYDRRAQIQTSSNPLDINGVTPMMGWNNTEHDVNHDYSQIKAVTNTYVWGDIYRAGAPSRTVKFRSMCVIWLPYTGGEQVIF